MHLDYFKAEIIRQKCCGSALVSMWIRIQGAKPTRIHADLDSDTDQPLPSQKIGYDIKNICTYVVNMS
jgi:hypothetical protein